MAYTDPMTVTINAIANTLARVGFGPSSGTFSKDDGSLKLSVAHQYGKRTRRTARIDLTKVAPDPLISSTNIVYGASVYLVVDVPKTGFTIAEQKQLVDGLTKWLTDTSGANTTKLLGGEI